MKLMSFSVSNYRSITRAHKIHLHDLTILVGKNNEGKSNIIKALSLSMNIIKRNFISRQSPYYSKYSDSEFGYVWQRDFPVLSQNKKTGSKNTKFELEFELTNEELIDFNRKTSSRLSTPDFIVVIEIGEDSYTVDKDGNLLDKDGNVFKEAKDVQDYLKQFEVDNSDSEDEINIQTIQKALGIELTDDEDKPIEFENSVEGVKSYINSVIEAQKKDIAESAVTAVFKQYPVLEDFLNYYIANGNSYEGFGKDPDRSNITIDDNDTG